MWADVFVQQLFHAMQTRMSRYSGGNFCTACRRRFAFSRRSSEVSGVRDGLTASATPSLGHWMEVPLVPVDNSKLNPKILKIYFAGVR